MTEEEYFREHYPDVCYNGKPLSPYWDLFQDGVEFGERQSEKKIEVLEKENEMFKKANEIIAQQRDGRDVDISILENQIEELETRCTELFLQNNEFAERFAKSIEIIKGLLSSCRNYPQENAEKMKQAEQFIKENGGKK